MLGSSNTYQFRALGYRAIVLANWKRSMANPRLIKAAKQSDDILFRATTVFPFVLFPDTLTIDKLKLTITHRLFFATAQVTSVQIEDILNVEASVGPFFGSLKVWTQVFTERASEVTKPLEINYLSRSNALEAERILQGYTIARHKNIDISGTSKRNLLTLLKKLGTDQSEMS